MDNLIAKLFGYKVDPEVLHSYRTVIPDTLRFHNELDEDGVYTVRVTEIDGKPLDEKVLLVSEAEKESDILSVVNDLIMTYYDVPEYLRPYYENDLTLEGDLSKDSVLVKA